MNDVVKADLNQEIALLLLKGEKVQDICRGLECDENSVMSVRSSADFLQIAQEQFEKESKINGLTALRNIKNIADDVESSQATKLKANIWLAENARNINELVSDGESAATMTQEQLARRLTELQKEAIKRAKPIDTGVIEHNSPNIDDMIE